MAEKRKVTMASFMVTVDADGQPQTHRHEVTDYVPLDILEVYVADARTRWQSVTVGDEHDPGPGGDDGETLIPGHLIGRKVEDFAVYGDASTPQNALDDAIGKVV